jgi:uncharacterized protein (DUF433 family)
MLNRLVEAPIRKRTSMQPVELYPGIISDPGILNGKPVIKGTRVPVALVLGKLAGGMSIDEVIYEYYLNIEGVRAALGYAAQRMAEEDIYVTEK